MRKMMKPVVAIGLLASLAVGCAKNNSSTLDNGQAKIAATTAMDSEQLAQAGEQLMSPYTFMLADTVFDMALSKDPSNSRARFYKAFLKPAMALRGSYKRARPFVSVVGDIRQYDGNIKTAPNSPLKDFIQSGPEDINTTADIQNVADKYVNALSDLYQFLKDNEDTPLTLNLNANVFEQQITKDAPSDCTVLSDDPNSTEGVNVICDYHDLLQRKIATADMITLRQSVAGVMLYAMLSNSYSADGIEQFYKNQNSETEGPAQVFAKLDKLPAFGRLRKAHKFGMLRTLGSDASAAWNYLVSRQAELCPAPQFQGQQITRKGFLFNNGICLVGSPDNQKSIGLLDAALKGPIETAAQTNDGRQINIVVNPFLMADRPIASLKSLFPTGFDSCGEATGLRDPSFGGILPNGEGNQFISKGCAK